MDALARLLGDGRERVADGLYVHRVDVGCWLRANAARGGLEDDDAANIAFSSVILAEALRDENGNRVFESAEETRALPIGFFVRASNAAIKLNRIDEIEGNDDLEKKSGATP